MSTHLAAPATPAASHYLNPRPGRFHCASVASGDCLAPAGWRGGGGVTAAPGVRRSDLHTCASCGDPVCATCKADHPTAGPVCGHHDPQDLYGGLDPAPQTQRDTGRHPWRWAACSITEFGPVGEQRHLVRKGDLTTFCGHSATHPEIWRANTRKPKCRTCDEASPRLLAGALR